MGLFSRKKNKVNIRPITAAVIPAAGSSSRMGGSDKLFALLSGIPVIAHTLLAFERSEAISEIVVATSDNNVLPIGDICREYEIKKVTHILRGGATRTESVYAALLNVGAKTEYVAIHDGARPLVAPGLIDGVADCAYKNGAAIPVVPLKDTIKLLKGGVAVATPNRADYGAVQTPQVFQIEIIKGALTRAIEEKWDITDDASALERLGMRIQTVPGSDDNIKITTRGDLAAAEALYANRARL
ncbi:2-C-methyl-D-erythritol 4-phosphate cytidylyltransferase [Clostridia bacterium]|nr:2-C-methyl-D-erythritol 4-phosphate cytidylyltransferase [Clostridia bacterium]